MMFPFFSVYLMGYCTFQHVKNTGLKTVVEPQISKPAKAGLPFSSLCKGNTLRIGSSIGGNDEKLTRPCGRTPNFNTETQARGRLAQSQDKQRTMRWAARASFQSCSARFQLDTSRWYLRRGAVGRGILGGV